MNFVCPEMDVKIKSYGCRVCYQVHSCRVCYHYIAVLFVIMTYLSR